MLAADNFTWSSTEGIRERSESETTKTGTATSARRGEVPDKRDRASRSSGRSPSEWLQLDNSFA